MASTNASLKVLIGTEVTTVNLKTTTDYVETADGSTLTSKLSSMSTDIGNKVTAVSGKGLSTNDYTTTEKNKLSGIASNAQVNQKAFSNVKVGNTTVASASETDTLTIAGSGIVNVSANSTNKSITISATAPTYGEVSESASGLMTSSMLSKLNGIEEGADANVNSFGSVSIVNSSGTTTATVSAGNVQDAIKLKPGNDNITIVKDTDNSIKITTANTTYNDATNKARGLMTASMVTKLEGIADGANKTVVDTALNKSSSNPVTNSAVTTAINGIGKIYIQNDSTTPPDGFKIGDIWIALSTT